MKIKNLKFQIVFVVFVVFVVFPQKVFAEKLSVGVYPPLIRIQTTTPDDIKTPLTIQNSSNDSVSLQISFRPFTSSKAGNGEVSFVNDEALDKLIKDQKISVLDNDSPVSEIEVGAKQSKTLALRINLSEQDMSIDSRFRGNDRERSGNDREKEKTSDYYFSVVFTSKNPETSSEILRTELAERAQNDNSARDKEKTAKTYISTGVAVNVLLSINPQGDPKVNIEEFSTLTLIDKGPVAFKVGAQNTGGYVVPLEGTILITNMFGQTIGKLDLASIYVLKNSSRIFPNTVWKENFLLGWYTATLNLRLASIRRSGLNSNESTITKTISFIAIPLQSVIIIVSVLGLIALIRTRIRRRQK